MVYGTRFRKRNKGRSTRKLRLQAKISDDQSYNLFRVEAVVDPTYFSDKCSLTRILSFLLLPFFVLCRIKSTSFKLTMSSDDELEWEEWDGASPFWHHCVAGSIAGVAEHTLVYPFDTAKTYLQACAHCPYTSSGSSHSSLSSATQQHAHSHKLATTTPAVGRTTGMWTTMRHIVSQAAAPTAAEAATTTATEQTTMVLSTNSGMGRLWRGVNTLMVGCIPAHALYFSTYEAVKHSLLQENGDLSPTGGMAAGAAAAISHDVIMSPLDTVKQRLQLGHYRGMMDALHSITKYEGHSGLFRSFPITLLTNIPYGMIMVSTNEMMKQKLQQHGGEEQQQPLTIRTCIVASSVGGMTAAALTTPLDRLKTFLQTQQLQPALCGQQGSCPKLTGPPLELNRALSLILQKEGFGGLFRGMVPRVITHTPAVAISWTTYETCKQWLLAATF